MRREVGWRGLAGLAGGAALVLLSMTMTVANTRLLKESTALVRHSNTVVLQLEELLSLAKDAETGQRGYLLTGQSEYLEPYQAAVQVINASLATLDGLIQGDPGQKVRAAEVRRTVAAKLQELRITIDARQRGDVSAATETVLGGGGNAAMDALRKAVAEMRNEETRLRQLRLAEETSAYQHTLFFGILSGVAALTAILVLVLYLRRYVRLRDGSEAALAAEAEKFRTTLLSIGDAVITTNTQGTIMSLNAIAEELTGWKEGRAVGKPLADVFHIVNETTRAEVESPVIRSLRAGAIVGLANHTVLVREDGTDIPIDDSAAPIRAAEGRIVGCVLVFRDVSERKRTEAQLHESDTRLRVTLASIGDAVIATDAAGKVSYLNAAASHLTGWSAEEAVGEPLATVFAVVNETTRERVEDLAAKALNQGIAVGLANHSVLIARNGTETSIDDSAAPIRDEAGQVIGAVLIFRDVTDRRRQVAELEERERQFRSLADSIPQLCWMAEPDGHITWYNRHWYDYTGTTLEQMEGWGWQSVHDPKILPSVMTRWQTSIAKGEPFEMVFPLRRADGFFGQFLTRVLPVKDGDGHVTRWFGTNTDVTEAVETQRALRQRERELQTLADNTPDVLSRFDRDLRHVFVNAAIEKITGRSPAEIVGRTNRELGLPGHLCALWETATRSVFENKKPTFIEFRYEALDGTRYFRTHLIPEIIAGGEVSNVLAVSHDRTAEVLAQDALRAADHRKDEFLATLAHELRNPLAPIRTGLQVLRKTQDADLVHRTQQMMDRQLGHMVRLIDDLMEVSRITSGKVVLRRERMSLQSAIAVAVEASRPHVETARHQFVLKLPEQPIWLDADPTRISQVIANLVGNAVKYSPDASSITLEAREEGGEAIATVQDTGVGIPADMLDQVFDMFAQIDRTLDRAQGGLGIGLALVKRLVEMHGGTVAGESPGLGQGSTFTLRLPTVTPGAQTGHEGSPAPAKPSRELRVLVVDDNVDAAETIEQLLKLYGHRTAVANSGQAALETAKEFRPDVVLLDIGMPGMNGYETARRFRRSEHLHATMLVALTGWGTHDDRLKSADAGFDRHLTKPVEAAELEEIIRFVQASKASAAFKGEHLSLVQPAGRRDQAG